jgi:UDP-N-acetylmuramate--alanine ligase
LKLGDIHKVYFIGIGGIGMSALARYFHRLGYDVAGYDRTPTARTDALSDEGIQVSFDDSPEAIPTGFTELPVDKLLVVYTPAVPTNHPGMGFLRSKGFNVIKRSEALRNVLTGKRTLAVAGTHGKTTTASMAAWLLNSGSHKANAFLGGIAANFNSNLVIAEDSPLAVVEADEYDRSFLKLQPEAAIITSMEADHLDIYGTSENLRSSFQEFAQLVPADGLLLIREGIEIEAEAPILTYAVESPEADLTTRNLSVSEGAYRFEVIFKGENLGKVEMHYPGRHNVENALAAIGLALHVGIEWDEISGALSDFLGVKRRFEYRIRKPDRVFIDDYAHHPTELDACIFSARELYPGKRITGVFQPHLYSRTRDFADEFARSLESLNELLLMEIYPAREEPLEGVNSQMLLDRVRMTNKKLVDREALIREVINLSPEVLLTMGAGDIDQMIEPLTNALEDEDE